ncbi:killer toxin resistant protein [Massospora cicadina]|nr:killer toxin resistant protein [Massospora cicadina]
MRLRGLIVSLLLNGPRIQFIGVSTALTPSPTVTVTLKTPWPAPPIKLEILELVPQFNTTAYFYALDKLTDPTFLDLAPASVPDPAAIYKAALELIFRDLVSQGSRQLFELQLALRSTAPGVQAYYQLYTDTVVPELSAAGPDVGFDPNCRNWVLYGGRQYCDLKQFERDLGTLPDGGMGEPKLLSFDHVYTPSVSRPGAVPTVILYGDVETLEFRGYHEYLIKAVDANRLNYVIRYVPPVRSEPQDLFLSGYGVHMDLKNTEYTAVDDRAYEAGEGQEEVAFDSEYAHFNNSQVNKLLPNPPVLAPISDEDFEGIGYKAARVVLGASNPLQTWSYLTQNFPKHAHRVVQKKAKRDGCAGVSFGHSFFHRANAPELLLVNGVPVSLPEVDVFRFLDLLRIEQTTMQAFRKVGIDPTEAISILKGAPPRKARKTKILVLWLNDLEHDELYEQWPTGVDELMGSRYGGYLPEVRLNYASVLLAFDMSAPESLETMVADILPLIESKVPVRFGLVALVTDSDLDWSSGLNAILNHLHLVGGRKGLITSLKALHNQANQDGQAILGTARGLLNKKELTFETLIPSERTQLHLAHTRSYMRRLGLDIKNPLLFVNGKRLPFEGNYQRPLLVALSSQLKFLQEKIYSAEVTDDTNLYDYFLSQPGVYKSFNPLVFGDGHGFHFTSYLEPRPELTRTLDELVYFVKDDAEGGLDTPLVSVVERAIQFLGEDSRARVAFVHNLQSDDSNGYSSSIYRQAQVGESGHTPISTLQKGAAKEVGEVEYWQAAHHALAALGLPLAAPYLLINGKVIPLQGPEDYSFVDFETLISFELNRRLKSLQPIVTASRAYKALASGRQRANFFMRVSGIIGANLDAHAKIARFEASPGTRKSLPEFEADSCRHTTGNSDAAWAHITYILNPLSKEGQRWAPILELLSHMDGVYLEGYLSPSDGIDDAKRLANQFYRYVLAPTLTFKGKQVVAPSARFSQLPADALLTTGLDTISAWLVTPTRSIHDLDNLELRKIPHGVEAEFELKNLLVEGHAQDASHASPRGLEFILGTPRNPALVDTVVMANLGYFQLKANPGVFHIGLREGRSAQLYDLRTIGLQGFTSPRVGAHRELVLNRFGGAILFPKFIGGGTPKGTWSTLTTLFSPKPRNPTINVFTVASGHLYERFLSVMIVSVVNNTKSPVKFWFVENFLSPSFKKFIPHLAAAYKFDYELVTYQWPHWLNPQTEKQRIIWGYKILFLDVLFPLNVDKVIFVDADQVVRADLKELVDVDLGGAPYGYVPFCTSRESMRGYRFWEHGYWAEHLEGKPYHISALYVVDLKRFRGLAAGDQLRGHYQMLSYDPHSLANLDQDLPNHLQPKLPIHSLPLEWLWCETWCDDASLAKAKTIDLVSFLTAPNLQCNNPETKEPKLDRARRILPEWQAYDSEIAPLRDAAFGAPPAAEKSAPADEPDEL